MSDDLGSSLHDTLLALELLEKQETKPNPKAKPDDLGSCLHDTLLALELLEKHETKPTPKAKPNTRPCPLLDLPLDLKFYILSFLTPDYPYKHRLRHTCRFFYNLIPFPPPLTSQYQQSVLDDEQFPEILYCRECVRLRPREYFEKQDVYVPYFLVQSWLGAARKRAMERICIECGLMSFRGEEPKFKRGMLIVTGEGEVVICKGCGMMKKWLKWEGLGARYCKNCWETWRDASKVKA